MKGECNCARYADTKLAELGVMVDWAHMVNPKTGAMVTRPQVKVRKLNPKSRKSLPIVAASFCPFCGAEFPHG